MNEDEKQARLFRKRIKAAIKDTDRIRHWGDGNFGALMEWFVGELRQVGYADAICSGTSKKQLPQGVRWEVLRSDNYTCRNCGSHSDLTVDHIVPRYHGGTDDKVNLATLCRSCNSRKGVTL